MTEVTDHDVIAAMIAFGGGFVSALGKLYLRADDDNRRRLRLAFPEYFTEYRDIARIKLERTPTMSRPPLDPTTKILELFLDVPHAERAMLVKFLAVITKDQARDVEPTETERAAVKPRKRRSAADLLPDEDERQ